MRLQEVDIRPGFVLKVVDSYGTVKASVVGVFSDEADPETLPPVYPFCTVGRGKFSQPKENDPIWVLLNRSNPQELFYLRQCNLSDQLNDELDKNYEDVEVLMRTDSGTGYAQILFDTSDGMVLQNDASTITIKNDGTISLSTGDPHQTLEVNSDGISLGSAGTSAEPAVLGDKTEDALNKLWNCINAIVTNLQSCDPYAAAAMGAVTAQMVLPKAKTAISQIKSKYVTLD